MDYRKEFEKAFSGKIRFHDFDFRYGRYVAKEPYVFGTDGQADRANTLFEGFQAALGANSGEAERLREELADMKRIFNTAMEIAEFPDAHLAPPREEEGAANIVERLMRIRSLIEASEADSLGTGTANNCEPWPIRDEVVYNLSRVIDRLRLHTKEEQ